jgi:hypothetical protein
LRLAFGRTYKNAAIEDTMRHALAAGVRRLDIFFMIGLPKQDYQSVMDTVDYSEYLMRDLDQGPRRRLIPFISPLAPFVDPGSAVFEHPEKYGYRLFARTFEQHRQALVQPSWKYVLNYETDWMNRDQIVDSTYEAGLRMNRLKARYGLVDPGQADNEARILKARRLIAQVDDIVGIEDAERRAKLLQAIKPQVDDANLSTVCDKAELNVPLTGIKLNVPRAAWFLVQQASGQRRDSSRLIVICDQLNQHHPRVCGRRPYLPGPAARWQPGTGWIGLVCGQDSVADGLPGWRGNQYRSRSGAEPRYTRRSNRAPSFGSYHDL